MMMITGQQQIRRGRRGTRPRRAADTSGTRPRRRRTPRRGRRACADQTLRRRAAMACLRAIEVSREVSAEISGTPRRTCTGSRRPRAAAPSRRRRRPSASAATGGCTDRSRPRRPRGARVARRRLRRRRPASPRRVQGRPWAPRPRERAMPAPRPRPREREMPPRPRERAMPAPPLGAPKRSTKNCKNPCLDRPLVLAP